MTPAWTFKDISTLFHLDFQINEPYSKLVFYGPQFYLQFQQQHHFVVGLEDLMEPDDPRRLLASLQDRDLMKYLLPEVSGAPPLAEHLGGVVTSRLAVATAAYRGVLPPTTQTKLTLTVK